MIGAAGYKGYNSMRRGGGSIDLFLLLLSLTVVMIMVALMSNIGSETGALWNSSCGSRRRRGSSCRMRHPRLVAHGGMGNTGR